MRRLFPVFQSHLDLAKDYWKNVVLPGDTVIDATIGNGQDAYFLARLLQGKGRLIGYDIQPDALSKAKILLASLPDNEKEIVELHLASHKIFLEREAKLIVYNLGYLPGGDKALTTRTESTLTSVEDALKIVQPGGAVSITCYPGHPEGALEESALIDFFKGLPPKNWSVSFHQWINRNQAPSLIWIQRSVSVPS